MLRALRRVYGAGARLARNITGPGRGAVRIWVWDLCFDWGDMMNHDNYTAMHNFLGGILCRVKGHARFRKHGETFQAETGAGWGTFQLYLCSRCGLQERRKVRAPKNVGPELKVTK